MKLSLINVFRNASFKKLDWLPELFFGIGFLITVFAMLWFRPNFNWFVVLMLPILVGLVTEGSFIVIHGIYICLKHNDHEIKYHKFGEEDYTTSESNKGYNKF